MTIPTTEIHTAFSDPEARATSWDDARQALAEAELAWIATVRADGRPHMTPLVAVWLDDAVHFCTGESEQKAVNLRGNQQVILMTGCNRWDGGLDVIVEGEVVRVTDLDTLHRLAAAWQRKWDGRWRYVVKDGGFQGGEHEDVLVFSVRPAKVLAFAKGEFSQTRHSF
jgi:nitroimidazol reductase NimA-like FMN-containing flavoprotein (pyridoxamine 5'-phosphate oxidase superfamily)